LLVPLPIMGLGLFAAVIQTFIFIMLTTVYIAGAEAEEH
jgi:F-type H+-transporting ATPase subunit a